MNRQSIVITLSAFLAGGASVCAYGFVRYVESTDDLIESDTKTLTHHAKEQTDYPHDL